MEEYYLERYKNDYGLLTKTLREKTPKFFTLLVLVIAKEELAKGFKITKVNKSSNKGTRFAFKRLEFIEELEEYRMSLTTYAKELKAEDLKQEIDNIIEQVIENEV